MSFFKLDPEPKGAVMKSAVLLFMFVVLTTTVGCMDESDRKAVVYSEPTVTNWFSDETFKTVSEVKQIDGFEFGRVIVEHVGTDRQLLSALVIPMRKVPIGSTVKIVLVVYPRGYTWNDTFLAIR